MVIISRKDGLKNFTIDFTYTSAAEKMIVAGVNDLETAIERVASMQSVFTNVNELEHILSGFLMNKLVDLVYVRNCVRTSACDFFENL